MANYPSNYTSVQPAIQTAINANNYSTVTANNASLASTTRFTASMEVDGTISTKNIDLDGINLKQVITSIQDRLAILTPDPAMLEKYEALREAYNHYKTLEALCK